MNEWMNIPYMNRDIDKSKIKVNWNALWMVVNIVNGILETKWSLRMCVCMCVYDCWSGMESKWITLNYALYTRRTHTYMHMHIYLSICWEYIKIIFSLCIFYGNKIKWKKNVHHNHHHQKYSSMIMAIVNVYYYMQKFGCKANKNGKNFFFLISSIIIGYNGFLHLFIINKNRFKNLKKKKFNLKKISKIPKFNIFYAINGISVKNMWINSLNKMPIANWLKRLKQKNKRKWIEKKLAP